MSEPALEIRGAVAEDEAKLLAIDRATRSPLSSPAPEPPADRPFFDERTAPERTLVAVLDGEPVGLIGLVNPTPVPSNAHVFEVCQLAVLDGFRKRGIGLALLRAASTWAERRGARRLTLRVLSSNPGARRLYERAGFDARGDASRRVRARRRRSSTTT